MKPFCCSCILHLQSKSDKYKALLAMAVGISQMQNVDTMARKVRARPELIPLTLNYVFHLVRKDLLVLPCSDVTVLFV
jgi:hypothetical protein